MSVRKIPVTRWLYRLHVWLGLVGGAGLLLVALSGAVIAFSQEIERATCEAVRRVSVPPQARRLPYDVLLANARHAVPDFGRYDYLRFPTAPDEAVEILYFPDDSYHSAFLDPYTGRLTGVLAYTLTRTLTRWHWSFFLGDAGAVLCLLLAGALVGSGLTGLAVYRKHLWPALTLRVPVRGPSGRRTVSGLHRVVGTWAALFTLLLGSTGAWINYNIVTGVYAYPEGAALRRPPQAPLAVSVDALLAETQRQLPGLVPGSFSFPQLVGGPVGISGTFATDGVLWRVGSGAEFDEHTGRLLTVRDGRRATASQKALSAFENLHYGQFGGWPVKLLYCLGGLAVAGLPLTGGLLWWGKRRTKSRAAGTLAAAS